MEKTNWQLAVSRRKTGLFRLVLMAWLALLSWGCGLFDLQSGGGTRAIVRLGRKRLVVLPFSMRDWSYFESKVGARLSRQIAEIIRARRRSADVVDVDGLPESVKRLRLDEQSMVEDLGKRLDADYVLIGEIHDLRAKDPKTFGVLMGTMVVSARVTDVRQGKVVWRMEREKVRYPRPLFGEYPLPARETDKLEVIRKVMNEAAIEIASVFTGRAPSD